jgi:hypothetical protein
VGSNMPRLSVCSPTICWRVQRPICGEFALFSAYTLLTSSLGPALCLYFAALRLCPSPARRRRDPNELQKRQTAVACPPGFRPFFEPWACAVSRIQSLAAEDTFDLARIICHKKPSALPTDLPSLIPTLPLLTRQRWPRSMHPCNRRRSACGCYRSISAPVVSATIYPCSPDRGQPRRSDLPNRAELGATRRCKRYGSVGL